MSEFLSAHPTLTFLGVIYLLGVILLYLITVAGLIWRFLGRNSIANQNRWLIGMETTWAGGHYIEKQPGRATLKDELSVLVGVAVFFVFNALLMNWIGLAIFAFAVLMIPKSIYEWIITPAKIRELRWRFDNIPLRRAEDVLALEKELIAPAHFDSVKQLAEVKERVESITLAYADDLWPKDRDRARKYVASAKRISKEQFDSEVIHPTFWAIPKTERAAKDAMGHYEP